MVKYFFADSTTSARLVTRDTWGFAVKATYGEVNGGPRSIFKCPKTDDGGKKSAKGLLLVDEGLQLVQGVSWEDFTDDGKNLLRAVYSDGELLRDHTLAEIRESGQRHVAKLIAPVALAA